MGLVGRENNGYHIDIKNAIFAMNVGIIVFVYTGYYPLWTYSISILMVIGVAYMGRESYGQ